MKKYLFASSIVLLITTGQVAMAATASTTPNVLQNIVNADERAEIVINKDGLVTLRNLKISQLAGTTLFTKLYWGDMFLRLTIKTNDKTKIYRRYGEPTTLKELNVDDYLNVDGSLEASGNSFNVIAKEIADLTVLKQTGTTLSGNIGKITDDKTFVLFSPNYGPVTVKMSSGASIIKGTLNTPLSSLKAGEKVMSASGEYNHADKTLSAAAVTVYIDLKQFEPKNYEGKIAEVVSDSLMKVRVAGKDYDLKIDEKTSFLNKSRNSISFKRFVAGDDIKFYGATSESAPTTIVAEVVRNLSL